MISMNIDTYEKWIERTKGKFLLHIHKQKTEEKKNWSKKTRAKLKNNIFIQRSLPHPFIDTIQLHKILVLIKVKTRIALRFACVLCEFQCFGGGWCAIQRNATVCARREGEKSERAKEKEKKKHRNRNINVASNTPKITWDCNEIIALPAAKRYHMATAKWFSHVTLSVTFVRQPGRSVGLVLCLPFSPAHNLFVNICTKNYATDDVLKYDVIEQVMACIQLANHWIEFNFVLREINLTLCHFPTQLIFGWGKFMVLAMGPGM